MTTEERRAKHAERQRRWRAENPEAHARYRDRWAAANREKMKTDHKVWQRANAGKTAGYRKRWVSANPGAVNCMAARRRAAKRNAQPPWLTGEQKAEMKALYIRARKEGMHVDHIVPLVHKRVCGLHVPWNLQLLTKSENLRKHNKWS